MDERLARTIAALTETGADWALLSAPDSIAYALGHAPPVETGATPLAAGPTVAVIGRDGAAGLLVLGNEPAAPRDGAVFRYDGYGRSQAAPATAGYAEALGRMLRHFGVGGRIAIESSTHPQAAEALLPPEARTDLTAALRRQRMTKTWAEIVALRRAGEIAATGQRQMVESLRPGISELALFGEIRVAMEVAAGTRLAVAGDLLSGPQRTAAITGWPGERIIAVGDAVLADLAPRVDGYWGDSSATVVLGTPSDAQQRLFEAARGALDHAVAVLRPGMTAWAAHGMIRDSVRRAGFDYPHHSGHGIGTSVHEHPRICDGETTILRAGMVLMIEPGAYDPAIGGVRTEWMLQVTETGCTPLSSFPLVASVPA